MHAIVRGPLVVEEVPAKLDVGAVESLHELSMEGIEGRIAVLPIDREDGRRRALDEVLEQGLPLGDTFLGTLSLGQIDRIRRDLAAPAGQPREADEHRDTTPVGSQVLLLIGCARAGLAEARRSPDRWPAPTPGA